MTKVQDMELPGPGHYQPKEKPYKPRYQQPSSTFASLSNRLVDPPTGIKVRFKFSFIHPFEINQFSGPFLKKTQENPQI